MSINAAVIGGGAAGFFAAIEVKRNFPQAQVTIFEKNNQVLRKVSVSGGGRCNLTNACTDLDELDKAYPRGGKQLKHLFREFGPEQTMEWFKSKGVQLVVQPDNCVFPRSQDSASITGILIREASRCGVHVVTGTKITGIRPGPQGSLTLEQEQGTQYEFNKVIVTTGGSPRKEGLLWLKELGHQIMDPIPSLFTFNIPSDPVTQLQGIVEEHVSASIQGTRIKAHGTLLITHWGMSGPAILKLSSFGAREIQKKGYDFTININWTGNMDQETVTQILEQTAKANPEKRVSSAKPFNMTQRLWEYLLEKNRLFANTSDGSQTARKWKEIKSKGINRLAEAIINDQYQVKGKSRFRQEFVTCGGVSLKSINTSTMESKIVPNLYFAGEILDIDAITGGYNLQAAWTTAFIAAKLKNS